MFTFYKRARYFFPFVIAAVAGAVLSGCYKEPKFETPRLDDIMSGFKTCAKGAEEQTFDASAPAVKLEGAAVYQDTEVVSCDGRRTMLKGHLQKDLWKTVALPLTPAVTEKLRAGDARFFKIQNQATCVNAVSGLKDLAGDRSAAKAVLTVDDLRLETGILNVRDGVNALHLQFFGPCERYDRRPDNADLRDKIRADNEGFECVQAPLLAEQDLVLDLKLSVTNLPGVHESKIDCAK